MLRTVEPILYRQFEEWRRAPRSYDLRCKHRTLAAYYSTEFPHVFRVVRTLAIGPRYATLWTQPTFGRSLGCSRMWAARNPKIQPGLS